MDSSEGDWEEPEAPQQFGPYTLHELINRGGMSEIWYATNHDNLPVAIRRLHSVSTFDFTTKSRFVHGAKVLSQIDHHELIVNYIEHGKINGMLFMAMEYIEGSNLKLLSAEGDPVVAENISELLINMALALEHVHDSGFVHMDFKPENILVSRNGAMRLIDFDLAIRKPDLPVKTKSNPGTPAYMAPEQLLRQPINQRVDIFAYGVSAYELLTGQKPFPGDSADEILHKQLNRGDFIPPRDINADIPPAMEKVILKCIDVEPDKRYPFMSVLVRDVQSALYVK
jgi:eukaryotic-like serine/threonine-protein kinase